MIAVSTLATVLLGWLVISLLIGVWLYVAQSLKESRRPRQTDADSEAERRAGPRDRRQAPFVPRPAHLERRMGPRDRRGVGTLLPG